MKKIKGKNINSHPEVLFGKTGILIVNLGTPESLSWFSIRRYLKEFLSDTRVIEVNRILWFLILNLIILNTRPSKTAAAYREIWMNENDKSPLRHYTELQKLKLSNKFKSDSTVVDYAMRYGSPSIKSKIFALQKKGCEKLIVLPLYPQYAAATTASVCDEVYRTLIKMRWQPSLQIIPHYESEPLYIKALASSIKNRIKALAWKPDIIIASFHGIPKRYFDNGDPYHCYCLKTSRLLEAKLNFSIPIKTTFQSRFGPEEWLTPYTEEVLSNLKGRNVMLICPGFSSDCIETLEEINIRGRELFIENGGKEFDYVPCLNDNNEHIKLLSHLIHKHLV